MVSLEGTRLLQSSLCLPYLFQFSVGLMILKLNIWWILNSSFCWLGDKEMSLIPEGTPSEMVFFCIKTELSWVSHNKLKLK
jgi:hypothetical protein